MRFSVGLRTCGVVLEIPYRDFFLRSPCAGVELGHAVLSADCEQTACPWREYPVRKFPMTKTHKFYATKVNFTHMKIQ